MDSTKCIQILEEAVCITFHGNTLGNDRNLSQNNYE